MSFAPILRSVGAADSGLSSSVDACETSGAVGQVHEQFICVRISVSDVLKLKLAHCRGNRILPRIIEVELGDGWLGVSAGSI